MEKITLTTIITLLSSCGGFYAYQYHMKPYLNITSVDALQEKGKEKNVFVIGTDFKLKNEGKSKANKSFYVFFRLAA